MSVMMQCRECGREMHSTGLRGLCPACLFSCTTMKFEAESFASDDDDGAFAYGMTVGPANRFLLLDKLGEGGMGEVWLADDRELSQEGEAHLVALKFLAPRISGNKRAVAMVRSEVLRTQILAHPNIVRVFDLHTTRKGVPFIKMEYVDGNSLSVWLKDRPGQVMPWPRVVQIAHELAGALQYAHEVALVVHRDIKPGNMLMKGGLTLKLSDFGIAQAMYAQGHQAHLALGTLAYASPQQLLGAPPNPSDDIYAMGATLYELLTGTPPFSGNTAEEIIEQVRFQEPESIQARRPAVEGEVGIPKKLTDLVYRCLQKDPQKRPHAREISALLPSPRNDNLVVDTRRWAELDKQIIKEPQPGFWVYATLTLLVVAGLFAAIKPEAAKALVTRALSFFNPPEVPPPPVDPPTEGEPDDPIDRPEPPKTASPIVKVYSPTRLDLKPSGWFRYQLSRKGEIIAENSRVGPGVVQLPDLEVGADYLVWAQQDRWRITNHFTVTTGVNLVTIEFGLENVYLSSTPSGANISWTAGAVGSASETSGTTPVRPQFRLGHVEFKLSHDGYHSTNVALNITKGMNRHHFILTKSISPIFGERASDQWENSLGMEFVYSSAQGLYVGRNEVRVSDFQAMHGTTPTGQFKGMVSVTKTGRVDAGRTWLEPGWEQTPEHPVIGLNWHDCVRYAEWLTGKERASGHLKPTQRYALPTTNEWFGFAGNSVYPWGNLISGLEGKYHVLNYSGTEAMRAENWPKDWPVLQSYYDAFEYTAPAGRMMPNALGLFHIGGNAAEWTADQVLCGSSWADGEAIKYADAWDRLELRRVLKEDADRRDDRFGFRLVIKEDAR